MTTEQVWLVAAGALALAALLVAALALRAAHRATARVEDLLARPTDARADAPETVAAPAPAEATPYVITGLDPAPPPPASATAARPVAERIDGRLFTDIVARETVVRAASWSHGIRHALSPEVRNRIAFQVRQQAKQQRRDRRTEVREALRQYRARQHADQRAGDGDAA